jgi:hypothetical protein
VDAPAGFRFLAELQDSRSWGEGPDDFTGATIDKVSFAQLFGSWTGRELFGTALRRSASSATAPCCAARRSPFRRSNLLSPGLHLQVAPRPDLEA